ncbi:uncharacterized protein LOC131954157 [Physella acuta]|uniref:uncharacterized protein LOC131954157 n=1 Tax=Physella acuta TaxID=109671 RepID=UPI0027DE22FA|nr:uncharacterized protein LOC131954157 [Physella acuta]
MATHTVLKLICIFVLTRLSTSNRPDQYHHPHHSHHKCPGHLITYRDRCFLVPSELNCRWHFAVKYCKIHEMVIWESQSNEELEFVRTLFGKIKFWSGIYRAHTGEVMSLSHHTLNLTLTMAEINETDTRYCVAFNNAIGYWENRDCDEKNTFICSVTLKDILHLRKHKEQHRLSHKSPPVNTVLGIVIAIMAALALIAAIYNRRSIKDKFNKGNFRHSLFSKLQEQ